jgi:TonB family protein
VVAAIHALLLMYMKSLDVPLKLEPDVIPDRFADYIPDVKDPISPLDLKKLAKVGEEPEEKVKQQETASKQAQQKAFVCDAACQQARDAARRARLAKRVARLGVLKLLGTKGAGTGTASNLIGGGGDDAGADRAFSNVGGLTVSGRSGQDLLVSGGAGEAVGIGDLGGKVGGPGSGGTGRMVRERVPRAVVKQSKAQISGAINADTVARAIRRGMREITSCYQRALKANPQLAGKVTVRITINTMGRVIAVELDEDSLGDPRVGRCIVNYIKRWRFPAPEGGEEQAVVAVPFVFQSAKPSS